MTTKRHLSNAPIIEAVIDIQVTLPDTDISKIKKAHTAISEEFPKQSERLRGSLTVKMGQPPDTDLNITGYAFRSTDERKIVQMRLDGFSFSILKPYDTWETLRDEAHKLWNLYYEITRPLSINRIAVRYINRLELPLPILDFNKYLVAPPTMPKQLPQGVANFLLRSLVPIPDSKTLVVLTQFLEPLKSEQFANIVLDIDVYETNQEDHELTPSNIWMKLENFHNLKNDFFFESITEETARLYE